MTNYNIQKKFIPNRGMWILPSYFGISLRGKMLDQSQRDYRIFARFVDTDAQTDEL